MIKIIISIALLATLSNAELSNKDRGYNKATDGSFNYLNSQEYIEKQSTLARDQLGFIEEQQKEKAMKEQSQANQLFIEELKKVTKKMTFEEAESYIKVMYKGNDYLSKEEAVVLLKSLKAAEQVVGNNNQEFILYFFSDSVPKNTTSNVLLDVGILQENGINIKTKQYLRGPSETFKDFVMGWKEFVDNYEPSHRNYIKNNFFLKLDPRFFKIYDIKKVPVIALATCNSLVPDTKSCKINYLIRGDTSLEVFFDKISKKDEKYKDYVRYLQSNKIIKERGKE